MKKMIFTLVFSLCAAVSLSAMNYEEAREQARFLTDKMAYELNLNDQQYNDCYEINLDYLLSVRTEADLYGDYLTYRNSDLRHILYDWQYTLFAAADYFFRPLTWYRGAWLFPIYRYYSLGHYYYHHPSVYTIRVVRIGTEVSADRTVAPSVIAVMQVIPHIVPIMELLAMAISHIMAAPRIMVVLPRIGAAMSPHVMMVHPHIVPLPAPTTWVAVAATTSTATVPAHVRTWTPVLKAVQTTVIPVPLVLPSVPLRTILPV